MTFEIIHIDGDWPAGISDGLIPHCAICNQRQWIDYTVDDEFWTNVIPRCIENKVVCLDCLDMLATLIGLDVTNSLLSVQFTGREKTIVLAKEKVYYYRNDRERICDEQ